MSSKTALGEDAAGGGGTFHLKSFTQSLSWVLPPIEVLVQQPLIGLIQSARHLAFKLKRCAAGENKVTENTLSNI